MPDASGRFKGMSVPASAKWPPPRPDRGVGYNGTCTCAGGKAGLPPAYHSPGCPEVAAVTAENRRGGRW